jgi:hypothetical protein
MSQIIIFSDGGSKNGLKPHQRSVGPYRIASELRNYGFSCQVVSYYTQFSLDEIEKIFEKYIDEDTMVVGFSTTFWNWGYGDSIPIRIEKVINLIRKNYQKKIKIVFGGPNGLELLKQNNYDIDYIFLGYADKIFSEFVCNLSLKKDPPAPDYYQNNIGVYNFKNNEFNFSRSSVVYIDEDYIFPGESVVLEVGRGCIFRCKFCDYPLNGKKKLDYLKCQEVLYEELSNNYYNYGIDKYVLSDDTFNDSQEKIQQLHQLFTSLPFKINFSAYLRLDLLNAHRDQIELLHEMGLRGTQFGIESFHDKASKIIGKGIDEKKSKKLLFDLKNEYWKSDVKIHTSFIVGLPYEDRESFKKLAGWISDEDYCLVDFVQIEPLYLDNPKHDSFPFSSEFQINSIKYGYYWPDKDARLMWKNFMHPIKSYIEAKSIKLDLEKVIQETCRNTLGGFNVFSNYAFTQFSQNKVSWEDQLSMDRYQYHNFYQSTIYPGINKYIEWYKSRILE